jgi:two-component system, OmpR family, sensor kinase
MKQRLASRLALSQMLVILLVVGVTSAVLLSQTRSYFERADRQSLIVQAEVAASTCSDTCVETGQFVADTRRAVRTDLPSAANVVQSQLNSPSNINLQQGRIAGQYDVTAGLLSRVRVIRSSEKAAETSSVVLAALDGRTTSSIRGRQVFAAVPIRRNGAVKAAVEVRSNLNDVDSVLRDLTKQMMLSLGIGGLIAGAFGFWRARAIAKPISVLTVASKALAQGDFAASLPAAGGNDEVSELTKSFGVMRDRLQRELATREAFVADASHELRTPLTAIRGAVEILQSGGADLPETRQRFLASLATETERLLKLSERLLTLQSAERVSDVDLIEDVDMTALVVEAVEQARPVADSADVSMEIKGASGASRVRGDAVRLHQVVANLLSNAIAHSPPGSRIVIDSAHIDSVLLRIDVCDEGSGVPDHERERVFERFVRLDESRSRHSGGAGLGLAISRAIIEAHGGTIRLVDGKGGVGTTARIELPIVE